MGRIACLALVAALAGCAKRPMIDGVPVPKGCNKEADNSERCMGWVLGRFLMMLGYREYDDRAIAAYVEAVGKRLARHAGDQKWTFRVVDDPDANAFAVIGGTIYIQRGILALLRSEAELAALLGHEMGHILGGHSREKLADAGRDVSRSQLAQSMSTRWARDDEIQADELAVILTARAGYEPRAVVTMLRALGGTHRYDDDEDPDAVHPWWPERIARAEALAAGSKTGELGVERYRERVVSLVVDYDPRNAALVDTAVVFGRLGMAIDLPLRRIVKQGSGSFEVELADGVTADISLTSEFWGEFARAIAADAPKRDNHATEIHVAGTSAIIISVTGRDAQRRARALRSAIRKPRPDELARLIPTRVDLNRPRSLFAR